MTNLDTKKYVDKEQSVDAIQLTEENYDDAAYRIGLIVLRAGSAVAGDYVVLSGSTLGVIEKKKFEERFELADAVPAKSEAPILSGHDGAFSLSLDPSKYDRQLVDEVRQIPDARWNVAERAWRIPQESAEAVQKFCDKHNAHVTTYAKDLLARDTRSSQDKCGTTWESGQWQWLKGERLAADHFKHVCFLDSGHSGYCRCDLGNCAAAHEPTNRTFPVTVMVDVDKYKEHAELEHRRKERRGPVCMLAQISSEDVDAAFAKWGDTQ